MIKFLLLVAEFQRHPPSDSSLRRSSLRWAITDAPMESPNSVKITKRDAQGLSLKEVEIQAPAWQPVFGNHLETDKCQHRGQAVVQVAEVVRSRRPRGRTTGRRPRMAIVKFEVNTMKASVVTPKMAGTLSMAKSRSVLSMANRTRNSGVTYRRLFRARTKLCYRANRRSPAAIFARPASGCCSPDALRHA